ncbi:superoxide dismutase [Mn], mitochondrial-like [Choloepus didactylus]|uniref:superoxide dismutase [Mn], mitochondrial-like n=1 Tax=Choloepus didactylus TaxID=27675 RepID=UPI00189DA812|nr:superoxide dismutase [Mn], mitochondrial-like [Choloepus didactylus]
MLSQAVCNMSRKLAQLWNLGFQAKHSLPDLPYDYCALEPHINVPIMQLHHSKHHIAYVNNLNATKEKYKEALAKADIKTWVALQPTLKFIGGGHINQTIFWTNLSLNGGRELKGDLIPLLGIDAWKHAYFLQYKHVRPDYPKAVRNVINWETANERYMTCKK